MTYKELLALSRKILFVETTSKTIPVTFTASNGSELNFEHAQEMLRTEFKKLAGGDDYYDRQDALPMVYRLIAETVDEILPKSIDKTVGRWAEVKTFKQGQKNTFQKRLGKSRAKSFVSRVGLSGTYDVFRLDHSSFEVPTNATGGAAQIGFEEYLDGLVDYSELTRIILNGIEDSIFTEIRNALESTAAQMTAGTNNKAVVNGMDYEALTNLIATARAYGSSVQIITGELLASKLTNHPAYTSDADKEDMRNQGYIGKIAGAEVIILPQSFTDETNTEKVFQDRYAYIIPAGGNDNKIVKVAVEGQTIVKQWENRDNSKELQAYKKIGVAMVTDAPQLCIYEDTSIPYVVHSN